MTQRTLDLDALLLEPGRITAPDGSSALLREYNEDDVVGLLRVVQSIQGQPEAGSVLVLADALAGFCADAETGRRVIDALPLTRIMDAIVWLQTASQPDFTVADAPEGLVVLGGRERAVRVLTVGTFRRLAAAGAVDLSADVAGALVRNAETMAGMVEDMTVEEWLKLPRPQTAAIERYITELMGQQAEAARPKVTRPRRARPTA